MNATPNPALQRTPPAPPLAPLSLKTLGKGETAVLRHAMVVLLFASVASHLGGQCSPPKLLRIVTQDASPGIPADSFATQPKVVYRLGKLYARVEEAEDKARGIHGLVVVSSPDSWMINLADGTGRHLIDGDRDPKVVLPILQPENFGGALPPEFLKLELGCEISFFKGWKSPIGVLKSPGGEKVKQAFGIGDFMVVLVRPKSEAPPEMLFLFRKGEIVFVLKYLSYEELAKPDTKLFAKPAGIKFEEHGPA
jgi:hypothetical protein